MLPCRWLVSITGKTINDPVGEAEIDWLHAVVESAMSKIGVTEFRWYSSLENVPMAGSDANFG